MGQETIQSYRAQPDRYDEFVDAAGVVRPQWEPFADWLKHADPADLDRRRSLAQRLLVAEGAGHSVETSAEESEPSGGADRLDLVPLLINQAEWAGLSRGLAQRATLMDAILRDLYGPQQLLRKGIIPPAVVLSNPGLRGWARGFTPAGGRPLVVYGADVVRDAAGDFVVLADHTDVPVGAGWALLDRSVLARALPELYRQIRVEPLEPYVDDLREALAAVAPPAADNPRIVVLASDQDADSFVDHSYLATRAGYNLVGGNDLVIRAGQVSLRSLGGLEAVTVLFRRIGDGVIDPVGGMSRHPGGLAAITEVARSGSVGIANAIGSGLGEHPGLMPYLGAACRALLGEDLLLQSVPTQWCGDPDQRREVVSNLGRYVLLDTDPDAGVSSVFGRDLSDDDSRSWLERIGLAPERYAAQMVLDMGSVPGLGCVGLQPTVTVMRLEVTLGPSGPRVRRGGLGLDVRPGVPIAAQRGGTGRDIWVLADRRTRLVVRRPPAALTIPQVDFRDSLPSRASEALFWVGRNAERAESTVRVARTLVSRFEQSPELVELDPAVWLAPALAGLRAVSGLAATKEAVAPKAVGATAPSEPVDQLMAELLAALGNRPGAAGDAMGFLVGSARSVREFLSGATWRVLGTIEAERAKLSLVNDRHDLFVVSESLDRLSLALLALSGLAGESIVRGPGWLFLDLGRRIERSILLLNLLEATLLDSPVVADEPARAPLYETLLAACESLVAYRRRHRSDLVLDAMLDLLLADPANPRGLAFQLGRIVNHLSDLPDRPARADQELLVLRAQTMVQIRRWNGNGMVMVAAGSRDDLMELLLTVRKLIEDLASSVIDTWFAHLGELPLARLVL